MPGVTFIAGDIGGTNCRLQLVKIDASLQALGGGEVLVAEHYYASKDFPSAQAAVKKFLDTYCSKDSWPFACCLAVAGPIIEKNVANVTNLKWVIDGKVLASALNIPHVIVINDFVGIGYGLLALRPHDVYQLNNVAPVPSSPIACIGAGTGLGECFLTHNGENYDVWASEGGHTDYAARNEQEYKLMEFIKKKQNLDRVSCERAISGLGLFHIYDYLRTVSPSKVNAEVEKRLLKEDVNYVISHAALTNQCELCVAAMDQFMSLYGGEAGNLAIKTLPFGGLYIAGGIAVKNMHSLLRNNNFMNGFLAKGRMKEMLERVPVYIVLNQSVGLMGASVMCRRVLQQHGKISSTPAPIKAKL